MNFNESESFNDIDLHYVFCETFELITIKDCFVAEYFITIDARRKIRLA